MHVKNTDDLAALVGTHLGYGEYHRVTQESINLFADATGDHQWIHVDPERAAAGPFGTTIAHGYLTLSLLPTLLRGLLTVDDVRMGVNYGANRVRFPAPVPVNSEVRAGATLAAVEALEGGAQVVLDVVVEVRDAPKPACVAQVVYRHYH
ncbi:MAG: MaoC family dehydratase [Acidimicrobiales bacterium]